MLFRAPVYSDALVAYVKPDFVTGAPYQDNPTALNGGLFRAKHTNMDAIARLQKKSILGELERLDVAECVLRGSSEWTALLLVWDNETSNDTIIAIDQYLIRFPVQGLFDGAPTHTYGTESAPSVMTKRLRSCWGERLPDPCLVKMSLTALVLLLVLQLLVINLLVLLRPTARRGPGRTLASALALLTTTIIL